MTGRDRPGWADPVPPDEPWRRYVVCGGCGRSMPWRRFLRHLRTCTGQEEAA